ncbi:MAG TPA: SCE4755 family polysaccharide monooxygenase-like protein, partial [Polyangiaceae bacterium]|nr:SCE4755 family polysaccharide monooxygenase-like protein [Polyangiaceae bacterium]
MAMRGISKRAATALGLSLTFGAATSSAHLDLTAPPPRLSGTAGGFQLKSGPCGQSANGRTDQVTVFEPGATITVEWTEYLDHPSYYRIAFDVDGDDDFPIRQNMDDVVRQGDDPEAENPVGGVVLAYVYEEPNLETYSAQVTLPDVECETCTLQVIQFMYDKLGNNMDDEYYFQCADIALRRSGGGGDAGAAGAPAGSGGTPPATGGSGG